MSARVLITGARGGIGRAAADELRRRGARVLWIVVVSVLMTLRPAGRRTPPAAAATERG